MENINWLLKKIPSQLNNLDTRFIKLARLDKRPIEEGWQIDSKRYTHLEDGSWKNKKTKEFHRVKAGSVIYKGTANNYSINDTEFIEHIQAGGNYGIATGFNNLVVIDFDNVGWYDKFKPLLPNTFIVKTKNGFHYYYHMTDDATSFKILDADKITVMDIQGESKQVVGPNNPIYYDKENITHTREPINDESISIWSMAELKAAMLSVFPENWLPKENQYQTGFYESNPIIAAIKSALPVSTYLKSIGVNTAINPTKCPFHDSKGGKCLGFDDTRGIWHCFHCGEKGTVVKLHQLQHSSSFRNSVKALCQQLNISISPLVDLRGEVLDCLCSKPIRRNDAIECLTLFFLKHNTVYTTRLDEKSEMWIYKDGIYTPQGRTYVQEFCREVLEAGYTTQMYGLCVAKIEADTYIETEEFFRQSNPYNIAVQNGVLDVTTGTLEPFNPRFRFFNKLPMEYDARIKPEATLAFFNGIFYEKDVPLVQELFATFLIKEFVIKKAIMLTGSGDNGKSKFIELIKRFVGLDNVACIALQDFGKDQWSAGELFGKLVNIGADIPSTPIDESSVFKSLVGNDPISAQRKFLTRLIFTNYAKMVFCANQLPIIKDDHEAFFNRWTLLTCPYTFKFKTEYDLAIDKTNTKVADGEIIEKISTMTELVGLLNWALEAVPRVLKQKEFSYSESNAKVREQWNIKSNSAIAFYNTEIVKKPGVYIKKDDFLNAYFEYTMQHNVKPMLRKDVIDTLEQKFGLYIKRLVIEGYQEACVMNVMFKNMKGEML